MKVTYAELCEMMGTTTEEMADAQEAAEREDWESQLKRAPQPKEESDD